MFSYFKNKIDTDNSILDWIEKTLLIDRTVMWVYRESHLNSKTIQSLKEYKADRPLTCIIIR